MEEIIKSKIEERNKLFYTEMGLKALEKRLKSLIELFNKNQFPFMARVLGFGDLSIQDKKECFNRIKELSNLIGGSSKIILKIEETKNKDNQIIKKEVLEYG